MKPYRSSDAEKLAANATVQVTVSVFVGVVVGLIAGRGNVQSWIFWATLAGTTVGTLLLIFAMKQKLFIASTQPEVLAGDQAALTSSIASSKRSAYAISSNWLELWRSSTFRYYLHLDAAMSLIAYSSSVASPLERLSTDAADQRAFFDFGWQVVRDIAAGNPPLRKHRLRLLIYPAWVYDRYENEVAHLIRSHSAARIPCIPVDADQLYEHLDSNDRILVETLVTELKQRVVDKLPPLSRFDAWRLRREERKRPEQERVKKFPDMLLIDSLGDYSTSAVWWYTKNGHVGKWTNHSHQFQTANGVFRNLCAKAEAAVWKGYAAETLGGVMVAIGSSTLESEAFFAGRYYADWLQAIRDRAGTTDWAQKLSSWLNHEEKALDEFIESYVSAYPERNANLKLIDLGCGFGRHLSRVLRNYGDMTAVGIDINAPMIAEAQREMRRAKVGSRTELVIGDMSATNGFERDEFDLAICMTNTLGNLSGSKRGESIKAIGQHLKEGGRVLFSVYSRDSVPVRLESYRAIGLDVAEREHRIVAAEGLESEAFSESELRDLLKANGLRVIGGVEAVTDIGWRIVAERPKVSPT